MPASKKKPANRITISEDMTIYNAAAQKEQLVGALAAATGRLEIDLSAVTEIDTAGFQLLMLIKREACRQDKQAQIVAHSEAVRDVIDFYHMAAEFGDPLLIPAQKA